MSLIGLQIYLALKFNFLIPKKKISIFSLLLGFSIPEIDFFTHITNTATLFEKNITHSIISVAFIYLIFLIFYEIKKNEWVLKIANGFIFGMIVNIFFNLLIRSGNIDIFWPLPIGIIKKYTYSALIFNIMMCLELIFFRLAYCKFIDIMIDAKSSGIYIKYLSSWIKIQAILIISFAITILLFDNLIIFFIIIYIPSYLVTIFSIIRLKSNFS